MGKYIDVKIHIFFLSNSTAEQENSQKCHIWYLVIDHLARSLLVHPKHGQRCDVLNSAIFVVPLCLSQINKVKIIYSWSFR